MATRRPRRNMDGDIQDYIERKAAIRWGPAQIHRGLERLLNKQGETRYPPNVRTIQRMVNDLVIKDTSGRWSIADSAAEDARLVLDVLAHGIATDLAHTFTKAQADWIIKVRKTAPDASNNVIYFLALLYLVKEDAGIDARTLDGYLSFTPWKDRDCLRRYKRAVAKRTLPQVPLWSILVDELFKSGRSDPRFTGSTEAISAFEKDVCERSARVEVDTIADLYDIHPDDVKDIIRKYEKGGTK